MADNDYLQRILTSLVYDVVDETPLEGEAPTERALRLALAKARAVAAEHPGAIVVGSDQVASLGEGAAARTRRRFRRRRRECVERSEPSVQPGSIG